MSEWESPVVEQFIILFYWNLPVYLGGINDDIRLQDKITFNLKAKSLNAPYPIVKQFS